MENVLKLEIWEVKYKNTQKKLESEMENERNLISNTKNLRTSFLLALRAIDNISLCYIKKYLERAGKGFTPLRTLAPSSTIEEDQF